MIRPPALYHFSEKKGIHSEVIRNLKQNLLELTIFILVIVLLAVGAYSRNRIWNDGVVLWTDTIQKSPNKALPYVNLGYAYLSLGDYEKAFETTKKAILIDPRFAPAYLNLSGIYQKWGDLRQAIQMGEKSLEIDPKLYVVHYAMGGIYFDDKQYEKAEESYKKFIQIYPYFPEVHNFLAVAYMSQRRFDKAIEAFEGEIRVNPFHSLAHVNLGQVYWYEFRNREKALTHLKAALLIDPFLPDRTKIKRLVQTIEESSS